MKKNSLRFACAACFCFAANFALAAEQTYLREYTYQASEADSKITARAIALQQVKQILLGELGTHVSALVKQDTTSDGRRLDSAFMHRFGWYSSAGRHFEFSRGYPFQLHRSWSHHESRLTSHSTTLQSP
jgi:hypothetical protein